MEQKEEPGFITPNADIGGAIDYIKLEAFIYNPVISDE